MDSDRDRTKEQANCQPIVGLVQEWAMSGVRHRLPGSRAIAHSGQMTSSRTTEDEAMALATTLPQADASSLVDAAALEAEVKEMYGRVAREEQSELHFEVGRDVAEHLGYPTTLLDAIPPEALASFAGVGWHLDLADLRAGESV